MPITNDEAVYIYWAKIIATTNQQWFILLTAGKPPLVHWLMVFFLNLLPSSYFLLAGRLPSVLGGLISLVGIYKIAKILFLDRKISFLASFLYILSPFALFYDRMALLDAFLSSMVVWSIYYAIKTSQTLKVKDGVLWGIFLGLAFLSKPTALLFIVLSPLAFIILLNRSGFRKNWKRCLLLILMAILISQLLHNTLIISHGYKDYLARSIDYRPSNQQLINDPLTLFIKNLKLSSDWLISFNTPLFSFLGLISFLLLYLKRKKNFAVLLTLWLTPIIAFSFFGKVYFSRYILYTEPFFLIAASYGIIWLRKRFGLLLSLLTLFVVLTPQLLFDLDLLTNPPKAPLPKTESWQYITGHPSSYGFETIYQYLDRQLLNNNVTLLVQGGLSHYPDAFRLRYFNNPKIDIHEQQTINSIDKLYMQARSTSQVFVLFHDNEKANMFAKDSINHLPVKIVAIGTKPEGHDSIYLTQLE